MPRPCNCSNSSCDKCNHVETCKFLESVVDCCDTIEEAVSGDSPNFLLDMKKQLAKYCRFYDVKK